MRTIRHLLATAGLATAIVATCGAAHGDTIAGWNFDSGSLSPSSGNGTACLVGGVTTDSLTAAGETGGYAWSTTNYPTADQSNKMAGVMFAVSTVGYTGITITFDLRHSNTSANKICLKYSTDAGANWVDSLSWTASAGDTWYDGRSADLTSIAGVSNNANFAVRVVAEFNSDKYYASKPTSTYASTGKLRFDNVVVSGDVVPEPGSILALGCGLIGLTGCIRRRKCS